MDRLDGTCATPPNVSVLVCACACLELCGSDLMLSLAPCNKCVRYVTLCACARMLANVYMHVSLVGECNSLISSFVEANGGWSVFAAA
jgi:hypothetical protein